MNLLLFGVWDSKFKVVVGQIIHIFQRGADIKQPQAVN